MIVAAGFTVKSLTDNKHKQHNVEPSTYKKHHNHKMQKFKSQAFTIHHILAKKSIKHGKHATMKQILTTAMSICL